MICLNQTSFQVSHINSKETGFQTSNSLTSGPRQEGAETPRVRRQGVGVAGSAVSAPGVQTSPRVKSLQGS